MHVIQAHNVNDALFLGLMQLCHMGDIEASRNGPVLVSPTPVSTVYARPRERVLFSPLRDANPFFHYVESMWMLAGFNDVSTPARYARQMEYYTDDGSILNGAYGYRWRRFFGYDQLTEIVRLLNRDPTSRRAVLAMWSASDLTNQVSKDLPCNTQIYFRVQNHESLDMLVTCRSNDIVWGAYGANSVHMSMLHEYMALRLGLTTGTYTQMSFNYHLYLERPDVERLLRYDKQTIGPNEILYLPDDRYTNEVHIVPARPLFASGDEQDHDLFFEDMSALLMNGVLYQPQSAYESETVRGVLYPIMNAHRLFRDGLIDDAIIETELIQAVDWRVACREWLQRRKAAVKK